MLVQHLRYRNRKGFLLLESLLALTILGILMVSIFPTVSFMFKRQRRTKYDAQASLLLQEGIEVAYNVFSANSNWDLYTSDVYKIVPTGTNLTWSLEHGSEITLQTRFTREIRIVPVCRNAVHERVDWNPDTGSCPAASAVDPGSRAVRTKVSWDEPGAKPLIAELLLTKFTSP